MFQRVLDQKLNSDLLGGFISALNSFATSFDEEGLSDFEMSNKRFVIAKKENLLFITNCERRIKTKEAREELQKVMNKFFQNYPPEVWKNWDGDASKFHGFEKKIDDSLVKVMERLNKGLWTV
jgi:hypothetical protein